jgi:hypothetical protein
MRQGLRAHQPCLAGEETKTSTGSGTIKHRRGRRRTIKVFTIFSWFYVLLLSFPSSSAVDCTTTLLIERVSGVERQLQQLISSLRNHPNSRVSVERAESPRSEEPADQEETTDPRHSGAGTADPDFGPTDESSYVGETSISRTLQQVEHSLHELGLPAKNTTTAISPASALLNEVPATSSSSFREWVLQTLTKHHLRPDKAEWDILLDLYCEDVHPLYPFFHLPSLRRSYAQLMGHNELSTAGKDSVAQVLICLALGRCTTSVRIETSEGTQSSGWAFYTAALDCIGGIIDPLRETSLGLQRLQVLTLMVWYPPDWCRRVKKLI